MNRVSIRLKRNIIAFICVLLIVAAMPLQAAAINLWEVFNEAEKAMSQGRYEEAIQKYLLVLPILIEDKDDTNTALVYGRLAKAYSALSKYDEAAAYWEKEGAMWAKLNKEQDAIIAYRKADGLKSQVKLFTELAASAVADKYYTGAKYEPVLGAYIGAYAELDEAVHDSSSAEKLYIDGFPKLTQKKHSAYLLYLSYGLPFSHYESHYAKAKEAGVAIQLALQPINGLDEIKDNKYLRQLAKDAKAAGIPIFLRFANEMNEPSAPWYTEPKKYIEKFRLVAKVFHEEAPNVVMVWAPNDFPPNTIAQYYPGDQYVDWIGMSSYRIQRPELDPLGLGIDRESYVEKLELLENLYGGKKPIFISEGAVSYTNISTGEDVTEWAAKETEAFFTYLPMLYPTVKAYFWFDADDIRKEAGITRSFALSKNKIILEAYKKGINNPFYLSNIGEQAPVFYSDVQEGGLAPREQVLHAYIKAVDPNIAKVTYKIGNELIGTAKSMPWTIRYNFNQYAGKDVTIAVTGYDKSGRVITTKEVPVLVGSANVSLDEKYLDFDKQPIRMEGKVFVPARQIAEASEAEYDWNSSTKTLTITKESKQVVLTIGSKSATINGKSVALDSAPFLESGYPYVPVRFMGEQVLGKKVLWDGTKNTVILE